MLRLRNTTVLRLTRAFATTSPASSHGLQNLLQKSPDDVVITLALRTPLCRAKKGGLKDTSSDELLLAMLKGVKDRMGFEAAEVEDIVVGTSIIPFRFIVY